jgi:hypothetical protein
VLAQHVEPARPRRIAIQLLRRDRLAGGEAFHHLEAVGGNQHGAGWLVHAVVGAADALEQPRDSLGRADLHHLVHRAPVNAEIERGGGDDGAQLPRRHRGFHLAPLLDGEAGVMQPDRQVFVVQLPQRLEDELRLGAGVDEDDGDLRVPDAAIHLGHRREAHLAAPGQATFGQQQLDHRLRPAGAEHQPDIARPRRGREEGAQRVGVGDRRREADAPRLRRQRRQPREAEGELVAALGAGQRMDLVDHHRAQRREEGGRLGQRQQQGEGFRRGEQQMRRVLALAAAAVRRRVPGAGLDADGQPHLGHRRGQVARDVHRERRERGDVERVQPFARGQVQVHEARQEARERLAAAGRRDEQRMLAGLGGLQHRKLVRARRPAAIGEPSAEEFGECSHVRGFFRTAAPSAAMRGKALPAPGRPRYLCLPRTNSTSAPKFGCSASICESTSAPARASISTLISVWLRLSQPGTSAADWSPRRTSSRSPMISRAMVWRCSSVNGFMCRPPP